MLPVMTTNNTDAVSEAYANWNHARGEVVKAAGAISADPSNQALFQDLSACLVAETAARAIFQAAYDAANAP